MREKGRNHLLWYGVSEQIGSFIGALAIFAPVNVYHHFKQEWESFAWRMEVLNQVFFSELQSKIALMYECMKGHAVEHHSDMWQGQNHNMYLQGWI